MGRRLAAAILAGLLTAAAVLMTASANAVELALDLDTEVSAVIGLDGGTLEMTTEEGAHYRLTIPPRALLQPEVIAMRRVTEVKGLPGTPVFAGGVEFEPQGLEFLADASLTITPAEPLPGNVVPVMWGFERDGEFPYMIPFRQEGNYYVRPVEHFSGEFVVGNSPESMAMPDFQDAVDAANASAAQAELRRNDLPNDTVEKAKARQRAIELIAKAADILGRARRCIILFGEDCDGAPNERINLREEVENGLIKPDFDALNQPTATCESGELAVRQAQSFEREWALLGVESDTADTHMLVIDSDGMKTRMSVSERVHQLCKEKAVVACSVQADVQPMITAALATERQRRLLGAATIGDLQERLEFLECKDALIDRCFTMGDHAPLVKLARLVDPALMDDDTTGLPERALIEDGIGMIEDALTKCARYKVTWQSATRVKALQPGDALGEEVVRGRYVAELSYKKIGTLEVGGRITGDGPAEFLECSDRLIKPTDYLSSTYASPCVGMGNFEAEITGMVLRRAAAPAVVELRGSVPAAWVDWTSCWKVTGCSTQKTISGGTLIYIAYQHARYQPRVGVLAGSVVVKNLKEPMGNRYPILFQGHLVVQSKIVESNWRDESDITIEHIGKR